MNIKLMSLVLFSFLYLCLLNRLHSKELDIQDFPSTEYRIGLFQDLTLDVEKITHIIVIGSTAKEDSDQFFQSGVSRALKYKELNPDNQVVIMSSPDVLNTNDDQVFSKYNVLVVSKVLEKFTAQKMINEMLNFKNIASFDFYGHSSPWALKIGDTNASFDPESHISSLTNLKTHFIKNAYVTLNACNTGFFIAPTLSEILELPVSGALTSSFFERIESDGLWYKESDSNQNQYTNINSFTYIQALTCNTGSCVRMKPSRYEYNSVWGHFISGGLGFNKFFCRYNKTDGSCERGMANSLFAFQSVHPISINSNAHEFQQVAIDWLCSTTKNKDDINICSKGIQDAIDRMDLVYQSFPTNELLCDFSSCHAKIICQSDETGNPKLGTCIVKTPINPEPTNVANELLSLLNGFYQLKNNELIK